MTKKVTIGETDVWITVDSMVVNQNTGQTKFVGYWSLMQPGLSLGESVKDKNGKTEQFSDETTAYHRAYAVARESL